MTTPDVYYLVEWFEDGGEEGDECRDFDQLKDAKEFWENHIETNATLYRVVNGNREFLA